MTLLMICIAPITAQAANTKIVVSNASAEQSQIVYLTVKLSDCAKADTLGIFFEYDSSVLKKIASECSWKNKGVLQDFNVAKDDGVWTTNKAKDLNGEICTLGFRVQADAPVGDTIVKCKLTVIKDNKTIGTFTAEGTIHVKGDSSEDNEPEEDNKQDEDVKQEGSEDTKPNKPDTSGGSKPSDKQENSGKPQNSKPQNSVGNNQSNQNNQDTFTELDEQQEVEGTTGNGVTEHQHTDAYDHDTEELNQVEETQGNRVTDLIWLACALLVGAGVVALIIKKVNRKKK